MPNELPRCQHCGYALIKGQCPIPCKGKPLREVEATPQEVNQMMYWTPNAA